MLGIGPGADGYGSKHANHCALLPLPLPTQPIIKKRSSNLKVNLN